MGSSFSIPSSGSKSFNIGSFATTQNSLQTALSLTGAGELVFLDCIPPASISGGEIKITIDGNVVLDNTTAISAGDKVIMGFWGTGLTMLSMTSTTKPVPSSLQFKNSLLIETKSDGTRNLQIQWGVAQ